MKPTLIKKTNTKVTVETCPDFWPIMQHCRDNFVVPNVTVNGEGITDEIAQRLGSLCGAVAVSLYDKDKTYKSVELISKYCKQVNIHAMLSEETSDFILQTLSDAHTDSRLKSLNAIVLLSLKRKGRAVTGFSRVSVEKYDQIINYALDNNVGLGFDSCGACRFIAWLKDNRPDMLEKYINYIEPCESSLFSMYVNVDGKFFPCSFIEGTVGWEEGFDVVNCNDFIKDIWWNEKTDDFRKSVISARESCGCPYYEI